MSTANGRVRRGRTHVAERLAEMVGRSAGASTVLGPGLAPHGVTVIPLARSRRSFGGGSGQADGAGGPTGSGGWEGAVVRPLGFIETGNGHARFRRSVGGCLLAATILGLALALRGRAARAMRALADERRAGSPEGPASELHDPGAFGVELGTPPAVGERASS